MAEITLAQLTQETLDGSGAFDALMRAFNAHIQEQFRANRIVGSDYSKVYLGGLDTVMTKALEFLLRKQEIDLQAQLLEQQIILAKLSADKALVEIELVKQQTENAKAEGALIVSNRDKVAADIRHIDADTLNIPKQGVILDNQALQIKQAITNATAEGLNIPKQGVVLDNQALQIKQATDNATAEGLNIPKQGFILDAQKLQIAAQTGLVTQQTANGVLEGKVLVAQECKLKADYDLTIQTIVKTGSEDLLLKAKITTEKAQYSAVGVDDNSVIGRQKNLYAAQTAGFTRDSEQKAAKLMIDSWNARRMTDDATVADGTNKLDDASIGRAVGKVLDGIGA